MIANTLAKLPVHLQERARVVFDTETKQRKFVLYWMCSAIRVDENPALESAILIAQQYDLPLLVYQGLASSYQYASDRHHTFVLQGARDVQASLKKRSISYAFHLETRHNKGAHLSTLAQQAAVVVTEDMPVGPATVFLSDLKKQSSTPVVCVDTACVVPMQLVGKAYTRAFEYRNATKALYEDRVKIDWPDGDALDAISALIFLNYFRCAR